VSPIEWTVDYGHGPQPCQVPHAWRQDVDVRWEGPAVYRSVVEVVEPGGLCFEGVSYRAEVFVDGELRLVHEGIWDAFWIDLTPWARAPVPIEVRVTKGGGPTFPVRDVLSGFLPYVFQTFGGIFRPVEFVPGSNPLEDLPPAPPTRVRVEGGRIFIEDKPFYARGLLHWGWYPEIGHTHPDDETIVRELDAVQTLGMNLVKFCLWVPPHRMLEAMAERGLEAWLELPLWDPSPDPDRLSAMEAEIAGIVRQYRRHANIVMWTVGCELSHATPPDFRRRLVELVQRETGCPLVKDNSGGAEMYGGDPQEFGSFDDFHPYCDTPFYAPVLDTLLPGARRAIPILLGEFDDYDVHRDLPRLRREAPYWTSTDPALNDVGVRWQHDLPGFLPLTPWAEDRPEQAALAESSRGKARFIRKTVHEAVRERESISGYVITGIRDTPISTSGFFDDWDQPRFSRDEIEPWNGDHALIRVPLRRPPWVRGGNRPGWQDASNFFAGTVRIRLAVHSVPGVLGTLRWQIRSVETEDVVAQGTAPSIPIGPLSTIEVGEVVWEQAPPGRYVLVARFGDAENRWPLGVEPGFEATAWSGWALHDPYGLFEGIDASGDGPTLGSAMPSDWDGRGILGLTGPETLPAPFWRECIQTFGPTVAGLGFAEAWERLLAISGDTVLDPAWLDAHAPGWSAEIVRIDTRTYVERPILVRTRQGGWITTLRPFGGLGIQPSGVRRNPSGSALLDGLRRLVEAGPP